VKLGGSPGSFPLWVDVEGGRAYGEESDTVAAARYIEALVAGELGLTVASDTVSLSSSPSSGLKWLFLSNIWLGEQSSVFIGRAAARATTFASPARLDSPEGQKFAKAEVLESPARGVAAVTFYGPGQVICLGSSAASSAQGSLSFSPRASDLSTKLSTPLESYDTAKGTWVKVGTLQVAPKMTFEVSLGPGEWKAFRVSSL
jgi:hypothetical protein